MCIRGVLQIAVQVSSFRNVDLSKQGLYQLRIQIYQRSKDFEKAF